MNLLVFNSIILCGLALMSVFLSRIDALKENQLRIFYLFAAGNLLAMVSMDIIPEAIGDIGTGGMILFVVVGAVLFHMIHELIHVLSSKKESVTYISVGTALITHGFPEGMALGAAIGAAQVSQRLSLIFIFLIHILPEMIMFQQAMKEKRNVKRINLILLSIIIFIPALLGVLLSISLGGKIDEAIGIMSATAAGFIFMLVIEELIFKGNKQLKIHETLIIILGSVTVALILGI